MRKKIIIFLLVIFAFLTCLIPTFNNQVAYASNINIVGAYSNVLDDLKQDNDFNIDNYPVVENDYSLQLMTIAESEKNELFIYVYQPSGENIDLMATSINISRKARNEDRTYINYKLSYLNSNGVFYKYLVLDFNFSFDTTRYYEISSIYRAWNSQYDEASGNDNTISEVAFKVGKQFVAENGELKVYDLETIQVTSKYVGFVRYEDGNWWHMWGESACDRHFVAFSTNKPINRLLEADVFYQSQSYHWRRPFDPIYVDTYNYGDIIDSYAYLNYSQKGNYDNGHYNYVWDRIQTVDDFVLSVNISNTYSSAVFNTSNFSKITDENISYLREQKWVLSFLETPYSVVRSLQEENYHSTSVGSVSILRLKFETDGVVYNLGVVDNKQSGDNVPDNFTKTNSGFTTPFKLILALIFIVVIVAVIIAVFPNALPVIGKILSALLKSVVVVISLPFKAIGLIKETVEEEKKKYNNKKKGNKKK